MYIFTYIQIHTRTRICVHTHIYASHVDAIFGISTSQSQIHTRTRMREEGVLVQRWNLCLTSACVCMYTQSHSCMNV